MMSLVVLSQYELRSRLRLLLPFSFPFTFPLTLKATYVVAKICQNSEHTS